MTIQKLAAERMIRGKANHPEQNWDDLTHEDLMVEAKEELADLYNYFSKSGDLKESAYLLLESLWTITNLPLDNIN